MPTICVTPRRSRFRTAERRRSRNGIPAIQPSPGGRPSLSEISDEGPIAVVEYLACENCAAAGSLDGPSFPSPIDYVFSSPTSGRMRGSPFFEWARKIDFASRFTFDHSRLRISPTRQPFYISEPREILQVLR